MSKRNATEAKPLPSVEYLNECFKYNPGTGSLIGRKRPASHFQDSKSTAKAKARRWNEKWAYRIVGCVGRCGYRRVLLDGRRVYVHRIIWKMVHKADTLLTVDHINGVKTDNRACNLREATKTEQMKNKALPSTNTSGYIGVVATKYGTWGSQGKRDGKSVHLGTYKCKHEAGRVAKEWRLAQGYSDRHGAS